VGGLVNETQGEERVEMYRTQVLKRLPVEGYSSGKELEEKWGGPSI